jgi:transcriptional regulator with XRE-family HTH domain
MDEPKPMTELTRIRQERNLSQQRLADASRVNKATINQIERGRRSPNVETLEKLAATLGVEVADFFPKVQGTLPLEDRPRARDIEVVGESFFIEPKEGEEPDIVTLRLYVWRELEKDEALLQKVARLVKDRDKAKAG